MTDLARAARRGGRRIVETNRAVCRISPKIARSRRFRVFALIDPRDSDGGDPVPVPIIIIEPRTSPVIGFLAFAAALRFGTYCVLLLMSDAEDMGGTPARHFLEPVPLLLFARRPETATPHALASQPSRHKQS